MGSLQDDYQNAKNRHPTGNTAIVCLDDGVAEDEYGKMGQRTIVPRATDFGGIINQTTPEDTKYGKNGFKRREVTMDENGFKVIDEQDDYRPDLFGTVDAPAAEEAPPSIDDVMFGETEKALSKTAEQAHPVHQPAPAMPTDQAAMMMTMMNTMTAMMQNMNGGQQMQPTQQPVQQPVEESVPVRQPAPAQAPAPAPAPVEAPTQARQRVTFGGDFGRFSATYAGARKENGFIVLATSADADASYEPPISPTKALSVSFGGENYSVLNLGLSFEYKGDILLIMPFTAEPSE